VRGCGFKPKAANTLWYDYDVLYEALNQGRLYGKDSKQLREASSTPLPEELINPVHRLWAIPPHNLKLIVTSLPYFIVDRVTLWEEPKEMMVINDSLPFYYEKEKLVGNLNKPETLVEYVKTREELNRIVDKKYEEAIEFTYKKIVVDHDTLVCESYADIALPWKGIKDLDLVLAVHPGYIQVFDPDRYLSALNLSKSLLQEKRTENVVELLKPINTIRVAPYRSGKIVKRVIEKLRPILKDSL
jgi:predicted P-loop ATPase/GTPase